MSLFNLKRGSPDKEFPTLKYNYTCMARILTPELYAHQFNRATQSGVIFDDVIRPALEEPGDVNRHYAIYRELMFLDHYALKTMEPGSVTS